MRLHYFPQQAIDGSWHTVYRTVDGVLVSVMAGAGCKSSASQEADRLNKLAESEELVYVDPADRPIPKGFYADADAA